MAFRVWPKVAWLSMLRGLSLHASDLGQQDSEDTVNINVVARSKVTHQNIPVDAVDLEVYFDGASQDIKSFKRLGCAPTSEGTVAVILSSTQELQSTVGPGASPTITSGGSREAIARKVLGLLPSNSPFEAYTWTPLLTPIRMFRPDGSIYTATFDKALDVFKRKRVISTGRFAAENHGGSLARWSDLEILANHLASRPGRKVVVWYCTNFSDRPDGYPVDAYGHEIWAASLGAMNRENLSVYAIDCSMANSQRRPNFEKLIQPEPMITGSQKIEPGELSEQVITSYTGGRFYTGANRLESAIRDGLADSKCSSEISLKPFGELRPRRTPSVSRLHSIKVTTRRHDVELLYPEVHLETGLPNAEPERLRLAENGLTYSVPLLGIPIRVTLLGAKIQVWYGAARLKFLPNQEGRLQTKLDVIWAYFDPSGARLKTGKHSEVTLTPKRGEIEAFREEEQLIEDQLQLPPAAKELRVVIREQVSGLMGSTSIVLSRRPDGLH